MKNGKQTHLTDWLTNDTVQIASKITNGGDRVLHDHSFYEIFYVVKGHIKHQMNGVEAIIQTGDVYFLNIGDKHIFLREENDVCEHRDIVIRPHFFKQICDAISPTFFEKITTGKIVNHINISTNHLKDYETRLNTFEQLLLQDVELGLTGIRLFCYDLLGMFFNKTILSEKANYPSWFFELLERFTDVNLLKAGLNEIIKPFYFSNEHICRVFKKYTGMTMTDYLNQRKIFEAANMLIYTSDSVSEICSNLGISSASYFNKLFKSQYHTTPLKFRKNTEII